MGKDCRGTADVQRLCDEFDDCAHRVLALNKENVVDELSPKEIKDIFDEEITNWSEVGGEDMPIRLFRLEDVTAHFTEEQLGASYEHAGACITSLVEATPGIIAFVPGQFIVQPDSVHLVKDNTISVADVFAGAEWFPNRHARAAVRLPAADYGHALGQLLRHPDSPALRFGGGHLYV